MVFLPCPPVVGSSVRTGRQSQVTLVLPFRAVRAEKDHDDYDGVVDDEDEEDAFHQEGDGDDNIWKAIERVLKKTAGIMMMTTTLPKIMIM